ncbi:class I SAM-dependent methyltransferase [Sinorhizobium americanum]|uniref:O-methyltransferase n=1 Tax=Sinorhizobium americanum TaxID=194963 RepID=A0A1L3LNT4_9HYPH|nr:class I SAM-dependent methyltransferase [Sinorhizobium americanum]APG85115.1 O-methyltransferase [Sinorhizobium americanum CCGM7]APG91760.1 O-methyltransferase [Sinorhizobium americanum]OAP47530.1 methyltransferase [Sinorhizobium americanum]
MSAAPSVGDSHARLMDRMYRYQRYIYDFTRKYYLFGRDTLIRELDAPPGGSVLEIGCGTGRNLAMIGDLYPRARLFGLDISAEMLATAKAKLRRHGRPDANLRVADATNFTAASFGETGFDRIVISYALSMIPDWQKAVDAAIGALNPGGSLHVADFGQQEGWPGGFRRLLQGWLKRFHVTPRESLFDVMRARADRDGAALELKSIGRGYAWIAVYRRPATERLA